MRPAEHDTPIDIYGIISSNALAMSILQINGSVVELSSFTTSSIEGNLKVKLLFSNLALSTVSLTDWSLGCDKFRIILLLLQSLGLVRRGEQCILEEGNCLQGLTELLVPALWLYTPQLP